MSDFPTDSILAELRTCPSHMRRAHGEFIGSVEALVRWIDSQNMDAKVALHAMLATTGLIVKHADLSEMPKGWFQDTLEVWMK